MLPGVNYGLAICENRHRITVKYHKRSKITICSVNFTDKQRIVMPLN